MHFVAFFLQNSPDPQQIQKLVLTFFAILPFIILICLAIVIVPFWFILKKAGFSPWLSLIYIVPFGNLFLYYFLAFADWKVVPAPQGNWPPQMPYPPYPTQNFPPQPPASPQG
jgi:hypothetical protein